MEQRFNSTTNELEIFGKTLTVELSGNYFFYPPENPPWSLRSHWGARGIPR